MANTYDSFEQYISENAALRQTLADTLAEKGVEASGKEGYASLVPKAVEALGGGNDNGGLPDGYTKLGYIQSSGTQYINTGFKANNNTRVVMDAAIISEVGTIASLFGARNTATSQNFSLLRNSAGNYRSDYNTEYSQEWTVDTSVRRIIDKDKETTTIDGTSQSYTNASFTTPVTLTLLAANNNGTIQWQAAARLYSCQIYDNGTLVRDFVPARNPEGEIGLYDKANSVFYGNAGTGEFAGGGNKFDTPLPEITSPATASEILSGYEAYGADGSKIVGEMSAGLKVKTGTVSISAGSSSTVSQNGTQYAIVASSIATQGNGGGAAGTSFTLFNSTYSPKVTVSSTGITISNNGTSSITFTYHIFHE